MKFMITQIKHWFQQGWHWVERWVYTLYYLWHAKVRTTTAITTVVGMVFLTCVGLGFVVTADNDERLVVTDGKIRVLLVPKTESTLSSQIGAKISEILVREGDRFDKGQVLIKFDCTVIEAEYTKAKAELKSAQENFRANQKLDQLSAVSHVEYIVSDANYHKAEADLLKSSALVNYCDVRAPFDGRVSEILVNPHESVAEGKPLVAVLDDSSLEVEMYVPSVWLSWLKQGSEFTIRIDETQKEYPAIVKALGARIDPVSQSIKIVAEMKEHFPELLSGMGGVAEFKIPQTTGAVTNPASTNLTPSVQPDETQSEENQRHKTPSWEEQTQN